ncbi:MAG: ATP synthase F1 subunit gamma [Candidatus Omnitrophica bacterium]|jgi:F-type H+-transporting ATPase subunit gamma|nr:ATP synthase F1 subunit gamma [Candidatus Omnitrophota bacterium]
MAQSIKQIKNRIRSVESTKKVTGAMQMVSVAKLSRIDKQLYALRPFSKRLIKLLNNLAACPSVAVSPLLEKRKPTGNIALCLVTADNGLCALYNQNIIHLAEEFIRENAGLNVKLVIIGQKGFNYFKSRNRQIINAYLGLNAHYSDTSCDKITEELCGLFLSRQVDKVYIAYTHFENSLVQKAVVEQLLYVGTDYIKPVEYIAEPDLTSILMDMVQGYLKVRMRLILLESFTSEHAARTVAMKAATDNAKDLLERLILSRNKLRQASITQEILEISSSVEALKG